uniref:Uncharacterized protein n=1 Tax=Arundo donax TaxID=35708 RepID=A0A0A9DXY9_ARUDO
MVNINSSRSHNTYWICSCKQSHQIEEVAALLNQSSPTVAIEPVPVVYLNKERETVFAYSHHSDLS